MLFKIMLILFLHMECTLSKTDTHQSGLIVCLREVFGLAKKTTKCQTFCNLLSGRAPAFSVLRYFPNIFAVPNCPLMVSKLSVVNLREVSVDIFESK